MIRRSATEMYEASWQYEASWYVKRPNTSPQAGQFLAPTIEEARADLITVLSNVDVLATGWVHLIDQVEDRVIASYLGTPPAMVDSPAHPPPPDRQGPGSCYLPRPPLNATGRTDPMTHHSASAHTMTALRLPRPTRQHC